jgi:hypothetical protein
MEPEHAVAKAVLRPRYLAELRGDEVDTLNSVADADSLESRIQALTLSHTGSMVRNHDRLRKIIELSRPIADAMSALPNGDVNEARILWGTLTLVLEVCLSRCALPTP